MLDAIFISIILLIAAGVPTAIIALNLVAMGRNGRRGLNVKCAAAAAIYGLAMLLSFGSRPLLLIGNDYVKFSIFAASGVLSVISATIALMGMYEIRHRPGRWSRGWKRAVWSFWLNVFNLFAISAFYYLAVNQDLFDRLLQSVK